jgi:hypothetical protein
MKLGLAAQGEEYRLWEFQNKVLKKMIGTKKNTGGVVWRKLHSEKFYRLLFSFGLYIPSFLFFLSFKKIKNLKNR